MPQVIKTLDDIIKREDRYDFKKIMFYAQTDDKELIVQDKTLLDVYWPLIRNQIRTYAVQKKERTYYRFKPHLLSLDVYGTPSLYWLILMMNDRECPSKFYLKQTVNLIPASVIASAYSIISTRSTKHIQENWNTYLKQVGEEIAW